MPTNGFYEWKELGTTKQPYLLTMADGSLFAFAGLWWERWRDPVSGEIVRYLHHHHDRAQRAFPVDRRVGDSKNEDAGLIEPLRPTGSLCRLLGLS